MPACLRTEAVLAKRAAHRLPYGERPASEAAVLAQSRTQKAIMRLNEDTVLVGRRCVLVPYKEKYVKRYHAWMQDEELLALTASERLTLDEEFENQRSWRDDATKLTFIVLDRAQCFQGDDRFPVGAMVGDVNAFLTVPDEPHGLSLIHI